MKTKKFKRVIAYIFAATAITVSLASVVTSASSASDSNSDSHVQTITSEDGVLSIEVPDDGNWVETTDPNYYFVLSDGKDIITIDHLCNGESLPQVQVANNDYKGVYQAFVSTTNEVFAVKALALEKEELQSLMDILGTLKVLKYDTKKAIQKDTTAQVAEFGLRKINATYYVTTDGLNVRSGCSTDDAVVGTLSYGEAVQVNGAVTRNGEDYGWYQISYNGGTGYVSTSFLSETASAKDFTSGTKVLYDKDGNTVKVYEATDGAWYDRSENKYNQTDDYTFERTDGTIFYVNKPASSTGLYVTGNSFTVFWENGNAETLTPYSDGNYYSSGNIRYTFSNGLYHGSDGTTLYSNAPDLGGGTSDDTEQHYLVRQEDGLEVLVSAGGGAYYDEEGTEYSWLEDGTMMDFYGHIYNVRW